MSFALILAGLVLLLFTGLPIFAGLTLFGGMLLVATQGGLGSVAEVIYGELNRYLLVAIPLFAFMAHAMIRSRIVDDLYGTAYTLTRHLPGGVGVATIAAAFWPKPVIVRLSDFKSNEYRKLLGGEQYEPEEENPMLGFRGAARYLAESFRACFELECAALRRVRDELGLTNVELMVPFVRTIDEARRVVELMAKNGLRRGENGLRIVMMCELPSNALLADGFLEYFDGFSIGSNDLTQLTLGLDRDSGLVAEEFDERNAAVKALLAMSIQACRKRGKYVGICGQGPSDHPDLARWLMEQGIESLSLNPDTVVATWQALAAPPRTPQRSAAA